MSVKDLEATETITFAADALRSGRERCKDSTLEEIMVEDNAESEEIGDEAPEPK